MTDAKMLPGFCTVTVGAKLRISATDTVDAGFEPLTQQVAEVVLDPYVVLDGLPTADSGHGGRVDFDGGSTSHHVYTADPMPADVDLKAWRRWLPAPEWITAPAAGGRRWFPIETPPGDMVPSGVGSSGVQVPRIAFYQSVAPSVIATGRATYGPLAPQLDTTYSYRGFNKEMHRNAIVFGGKGNASIETEEVLDEITVGMVIVFHPSGYPHYGIFEAAQSAPDTATPGEPMQLRYSHGLFAFYQANVRVVSHESHKSSHQAMIILLSMSASEDAGKMMAIDNTRTTREFQIPNLDFVSFGGLFGAEGQITVDNPVVNSSDMDLLEFTIWDTALDFAQMEEKANLLCLAYGIAG